MFLGHLLHKTRDVHSLLVKSIVKFHKITFMCLIEKIEFAEIYAY